MPQILTFAWFFPPNFSAHFVGFLFSYFLPFSFIFLTLSGKWRLTMFVLQLRHLFFLQSSGQSVKEIVWMMSEQLVESKDFRRQTKEWMARFCFTNCVRNVSEKAICVIIQQDRKVKNFNFTISKFWAQRYGAIWPTKVGKPWRAKTAGHTSCKYDVRRICKLYTERTTGR